MNDTLGGEGSGGKDRGRGMSDKSKRWGERWKWSRNLGMEMNADLGRKGKRWRRGVGKF